MKHCNDAGPFELLQARQLLESNIAEFAALQATREDIIKMRQALQLEERELASSAPGGSESGDMQFHLAIAEATHNSMLVELFRQSWQWRENNPMWIQLHRHLGDTHYREEWLVDHKRIRRSAVTPACNANTDNHSHLYCRPARTMVRLPHPMKPHLQCRKPHEQYSWAERAGPPGAEKNLLRQRVYGVW